MRGVDVRVIIPGLADKWLVKRAAMAYVPQVTQAGVKMYEYGRGFMHQKVMLLDDDVSRHFPFGFRLEPIQDRNVS